jgi:hypothetical protein
VVAVVRPLADAITENQSVYAKGEVRYDFTVGDKGEFDFFIWANGQLRRWHFGKETGWQKRASIAFEMGEDFIVTKDDDNFTLITEAGQHYLIGEKEVTLITNDEVKLPGSNDGKSYLIIDSDKHEHYFFRTDKEARWVTASESVHYKDRKLAEGMLSSQIAATMNAVLAASAQK